MGMPPDVRFAFQSFAPTLRNPLRQLRSLILEEARRLNVDPLTETLKWGQPAYLTDVVRSGTTIRLGSIKSKPGMYAAFFSCQSTMIDDIRDRFGDAFLYEKKRAILAPIAEPIDAATWSSCFEMALLYKRRSF